eukprot:COSAG02_NODE_1363_length_13047_cov_5.747374_10_plen_273_part_00
MAADLLIANAADGLLSDSDSTGSGALRSKTLDALEAHGAPLPNPKALAPVFADVLAADVSEIDRETHDRVGLLLARLFVEAMPDYEPIYAAAFGGQRLQKLWNANGTVGAALHGKAASELTRADAISCACAFAHSELAMARGFTAPFGTIGLTARDWLALFTDSHPLGGKKWFSTDDVPRRMLELTLELLQSSELSDVARMGAWYTIVCCPFHPRPAVARLAVQWGIFDKAVAQLRDLGSPADWIVRRSAHSALCNPVCPHTLGIALASVAE